MPLKPIPVEPFTHNQKIQKDIPPTQFTIREIKSSESEEMRFFQKLHGQIGYFLVESEKFTTEQLSGLSNIFQQAVLKVQQKKGKLLLSRWHKIKEDERRGSNF